MRIAKTSSNTGMMTRRAAVASLALLAAAGWLGVATSVPAASDRIFARVCAERDVTVITLIEDHGNADLIEPIVGNETLGRAGMMVLDARDACYRGQVAESVAIYDKIAAMLGPAPAAQVH